ncbi:MAG: cytochrome C [Gammaproteobacteria bacterium]|nr:cytochrome C [Gammaproteobacteria bacterium]
MTTTGKLERVIKATLLLLLTAAGLLQAGATHAQTGEELLDSKGCLGCHAMDSRKVGPALKDVAAKYKDEPQAESKLIAALKEGKGHPVKADASDAELRAIVQHILTAQAPSAKSAEPVAAEPAAVKPDNATCLGCHGNEGFAMPGADGKMRSLHVRQENFESSVHGKRQCVECHKDITQIPHQKVAQRKVSCVQCHEALWATAQKENKTAENARLGVVVSQIEKYMHSIHARPSRDDQSRTNATCYNCHDAHYVYPKGSAARTEWRLSIPDACGKCHAKQREAYATSVHGKEVLENRDPSAAVCSDCHTTHDIETPEADSSRLVITKNCGSCHAESLRTYTETYHGQVNTLGYAYTAKCFDCHGSHTIQRVSEPESMVHPARRLETCRKCHAEASVGYASFEPHATSHDFSRYPQVWIATKFMIALLVGVFVFFWTHTALWFYREYRDRQQGKARPHVVADESLQLQGKQYQRFGPVWRLAHLVFAISVMTLVLTGMAVFFADTTWAKVVAGAFGGPKIAAIVHRTAAAIMLSIFFVHLVYLTARIARHWRSFRWFGPTSLVPTWQDLKDIGAMFAWFFGRRPRPEFDRWTYWEKFDYWAVFWGMAIIGGSGLMLAFPTATASVLPGWMFNVATIVHGEEAVLAAVFLFTVHFFNNHFRPDKFPLDLVMFTGAVPLEEFRREHALEYQRLVETGQLAKHLVDAPSRPMTLGSKVLGFTLIAFGLTLLVLVLTGLAAHAG